MSTMTTLCVRDRSIYRLKRSGWDEAVDARRVLCALGAMGASEANAPNAPNALVGPVARLPDDLFVEIFAHLVPIDVFFATQACRKWRLLVVDSVRNADGALSQRLVETAKMDLLQSKQFLDEFETAVYMAQFLSQTPKHALRCDGHECARIIAHWKTLAGETGRKLYVESIPHEELPEAVAQGAVAAVAGAALTAVGNTDATNAATDAATDAAAEPISRGAISPSFGIALGVWWHTVQIFVKTEGTVTRLASVRVPYDVEAVFWDNATRELQAVVRIGRGKHVRIRAR